MAHFQQALRGKPEVIWSWIFEIILPGTALLGDRCVADYQDIVYYALGALLASLFWKWWYAGTVANQGASADGGGESKESE